MAENREAMETVKATFSWSLYNKPGKDFQVSEFKNTDTGQIFTVVGSNLPDRKSLAVKLYGQWKLNPKTGKKQFAMEYYEIPRQTDEDGIIAYLGSLKCGAGPVKANAICSHFGEAAWDIISNHPSRLSEVKGIGASLAKKIEDASTKYMGLKDVIVLFTQAHARITPYQANAFLTAHPKDPAGALRENPYCACRIDGVTFDKCDAVAELIGFPSDHPERIKAFINKLLGDAAAHGHVCLPARELMDTMIDRLAVSEEQCRTALNAVWEEGYIRTTNHMVYSARSYEEEKTVAREVRRLLNAPMKPVTDIESPITDYEQQNFSLAESQKKAVRTVFKSPLSIITGGPGTGKTTVIKAILSVHKAVYGEESEPILLAPTGRAARRMSEATGYPAKTIHSAVGYRGMETEADFDAELDGNLIIVDECSMMDQRATCSATSLKR